MSENPVSSPVVPAIDYGQLARPFATSEVKWRIEKLPTEPQIGRKVPYIAAHQVQSRLDEVVLPHRWAVSFTEVFSGARLATVRCKLSIQQADGTWLSKEDAGAVPQAAARGEALDLDRIYKGAYSDALKRAAVQWGIGRDLKLLGPVMVRLDDQGNELGPLVDTTMSNVSTPPEVPAQEPLGLAAEALAASALASPESAGGPAPAAEPSGAEPLPPKVTDEGPVESPTEVGQPSPEHSVPSEVKGPSDTYSKAKLRIEGGRVPAGPMLSYLNSDMAKAGLFPGEYEDLVALLKKKFPDANLGT